MAATILQYEGSMVAPKDDAILYHMMNAQAGVVKGCSITYLGTNQIRLGAGYVYVCGRLVKIDEETVLSPFADEAGAAGELILKIDLLSDTPAKVLARTPRQELIQTDINGEGAVYEYLLASYTVTDVAISGLTIEYTVASAAIPQDRLLGSLEEIALVTEPGYVADALAVKSLNSKIKILWEGVINTAQTITLNSTDYDLLEVTYRLYVNYTDTVGKVKKGETGYISGTINPGGALTAQTYTLMQDFSVSEDGATVTFGQPVAWVSNTYGPSATDRIYITRIIGYKL